MRRLEIRLLLLWLVLCVALLSRPAAAQDPPFAFPAMQGWTVAGQPQTFSPDTLYEYIDGGADLYLKYDFEELRVAEYKDDKQASVTVEVYRHRSPNDAFGIYSQERFPTATFLDIGAQGYSESEVLNFIKGRYYVKISGYHTGADEKAIMLAFARQLSQGLPGPASLPAILSAFPAEGKKENSEKFVARDFLGYSFLHSGFTADYEVSGRKFQLFAIEGQSPEDCRAMLERYLKESGEVVAGIAEGRHRVKDRYHGEMELLWKGRHVWGTMSLDDAALRAKYLRQIEDSPKT